MKTLVEKRLSRLSAWENSESGSRVTDSRSLTDAPELAGVRSRRGPLDFDVTDQPFESEQFTYEPASPSSSTESGESE